MLIEDPLASVWLPDGAKVKQPLPKLGAKWQKGMIALDLEVHEIIRQAMLEGMSRALPVNPDCELTVIEDPKLQLNYSNHHQIVQSRTIATGVHVTRWDCLVESDHRKAIINVLGFGSFADTREVSTQILESFRFGNGRSIEPPIESVILRSPATAPSQAKIATQTTSQPDTVARWIEAKVAGQSPIHSVVLRIVETKADDRPEITRYMIGNMPAGKLPFGIDHPENLESVFDDADSKLGIKRHEWTELSSPPDYAGVIDSAIDEAINKYMAWKVDEAP